MTGAASSGALAFGRGAWLRGQAHVRPALWVPVFLGVYVALGLFSELWLGITTDHPLGEDFKIYFGAFEEALDGGNPYEPYGIGTGYVNHPAALSFVSLFAWSHDDRLAMWLWMGASAIAWIVSVRLAQTLARDVWPQAPRADAAWRNALVTAIFLGFAPLWETLHLGQVNAFAVLCSLGALHFAQRGRPVASGASLALAIVLKTSPAVLLAYFIATRRFAIVAWTLIGIALASGGAAVQFSPGVLGQFREILPKLGSEIHPFTYNQSLLSVLHQASPALRGGRIETVLRDAHTAAFAAVAGVLLLRGWFDERAGGRRGAWLFILLIALSVFFSPLVWYHHTTLLLLPLAALLVSPDGRVFALGLGMALVLQAERLFEQTATLTAYPVVAVHAALILVLAYAYVTSSVRTNAASDQAAAAGEAR